jgi:Uma2 family endonuclease
VEEYLAIDRAAEIPSEYHDGEMFPIEAVSWEYSLISVNIGRVLAERLDKTPCRVAGGPLRVRATPTRFVLPDLMVVCGKPVLTDEHQDTLTNPKVIVEILSPSTADYDYGKSLSCTAASSHLKNTCWWRRIKLALKCFARLPTSGG